MQKNVRNICICLILEFGVLYVNTVLHFAAQSLFFLCASCPFFINFNAYSYFVILAGLITQGTISCYFPTFSKISMNTSSPDIRFCPPFPQAVPESDSFSSLLPLFCCLYSINLQLTLYEKYQ